MDNRENGLQALKEAAAALHRQCNKTERSSREAAKALGRMLASFDVKYGPSKIDWDDLSRMTYDS